MWPLRKMVHLMWLPPQGFLPLSQTASLVMLFQMEVASDSRASVQHTVALYPLICLWPLDGLVTYSLSLDP